jgi:hypothetical protein
MPDRNKEKCQSLLTLRANSNAPSRSRHPVCWLQQRLVLANSVPGFGKRPTRTGSEFAIPQRIPIPDLHPVRDDYFGTRTGAAEVRDGREDLL